MPDIAAFHGIRYDLAQVGSLSSVIAPPYDVIDSQLQQELCDKHPANCVRIILGQDHEGDDDSNNRYTRAARTMRTWLREGILFAEGEPAIYVYHQVFTERGQEFTRRGFMCRTRLERFGEGNIFPHEETHGGAKADRLKLWKACKANCSQIFGLYPDEANVAQEILEEAVRGVAPLEATDHLGVLHRLWPVSDIAKITDVISAMGGLPIYIADGHHRYETACNYRDELASELAAKGEQLDPEHPANFVLMMCVSMSDPGMIVLPTHRLFRGVPKITAEELRDRLGECFDCEEFGQGPELAKSLWQEIEMEGDQGTLGFFTAEDQTWTLARLTAEGQQKMSELSTDHCADWQGLGVSLLHRLVVEHLLDMPNLPAPKYVRAIEEVVEGLKQGDSAGRDHTGQQGTGGRFELAAMVMPATVDHIRAISNAGERMPAKSTYFYPKLLSGLLFNPLD